jgi:amino acid transporter
MISAAGMLNALLCTSARVPFAMARRGMLPDALAAQHVKFVTPWKALLVNSIGVAALMPFSFQDLIEVDMFLYAAAMILEFAALIWLRVRRPEMARPYRVPFGLAGAIAISIPPVALCLISIALSNEATRYVGLSGFVAGLLIYRCRAKPSEGTEVKPAPTA